MTNVKAGDLAIVVKADNPQNLHIIVRVIKALPIDQVAGIRFVSFQAAKYWCDPDTRAVWAVESLGRPFVLEAFTLAGEVAFVEHRSIVARCDSSLRPLRDTDEPDQMPRVTDKELTT